MTNGYNTPIGVPIGLPSILSLGLPPLVNPYPTLNLDFINNPQFDSRITFSRGSQATLFDSTGTLVYAKHNLLLQSQTFQTTWATSTATVSADAGVAPDGTLTADKVIPDNAATGRVQQTFTTATGFTYTFSCFVKADGFDWVALGMAAPGAYFDLSGAGAVGTTPAGYTASITSVGSGWYRCVVTLTESGGAARTWRINPASADNTLAVGDGTSGILVWGAQLNLANMEGGVTSSLTTYYPTTTAAYYAPRFDYDPSTLQPRGLLIEEARTNLESYSDDFSNVFWTKNNATVSSNVIIAPDGNLTGDKLITDSGLTTGQVFATTTLAASTTFTFSCFAKAGEWSWTNLATRGPENIDIGAWFNLSAGTVGTVSAGVTASITPVGNGWYRCAVTRTTGTGATASRQRIHSTNADNAYSTGDGTSGIYIWGAQLEAGAFATSYIPTTTTALTRNADVASMTGTNFSSWYSASEGTMFGEAFVHTAPNNGNIPCILSFDDGTANNRIQIYRANNSGNPNLGFVVVSGGSVSTIRTTASTQSQPGKIAGAYKVDDFAASGNGSTPSTDTTGTVPTVTQAQIGNGTGSGIVNLNGWIARIAYYPTRLPNATLQALTA